MRSQLSRRQMEAQLSEHHDMAVRFSFRLATYYHGIGRRRRSRKTIAA
jgi:hypothetical protein